MTRYGQFCPVAKASEIIAERWTPLILRELLCGSHRFSELEHGLPRISRSLLAQRLRFLENAGLVERRISRDSRSPEYHLTDAGQDLYEVIIRLGEWSHRWFNPLVDEDDLDPQLLLWDMHRRLQGLPARSAGRRPVRLHRGAQRQLLAHFRAARVLRLLGPAGFRGRPHRPHRHAGHAPCLARPPVVRGCAQ